MWWSLRGHHSYVGIAASVFREKNEAGYVVSGHKRLRYNTCSNDEGNALVRRSEHMTFLSSVQAICADQLRHQFPLSLGAHGFGSDQSHCVCPSFHQTHAIHK